MHKSYIKCTERISVSFPGDYLDELKAVALLHDTDVSKLILDRLFLADKGETHTEHKANHQRKLIDEQAKAMRQEGCSK